MCALLVACLLQQAAALPLRPPSASVGDDIYAYANPPKAPGAEDGAGVYMGKPGSFHVPRNRAANRKQQKEQLYEAYNLLHSLAQVRA